MTAVDPQEELTVGGYLADLAHDQLEAPSHLWGFGGLQGGMILAVLAERAQRRAPGMPIRSVTGRYHRPVRGEFRVEAATLKDRGTVLAFASCARSGDMTLADATVVLGAGQSTGYPVRAVSAPPVPAPERCPVFPVPREFVPASSQVEIRLAGPNVPYGGQADAKLLAWVRVTSDDLTPDSLRLLFLLDMLAPSYSAVLDSLVPMPTLELSVQFTGSPLEPSPWVLLSARTRHAPGDGWLVEDFDAWAPDGTHIATARQVRIIRD